LFCEITFTSVPAAIGASAAAVHSASPIITRPVFGGSIAERALSAYSETGAAIWSAAKWSYAHVRELVK